MSVEDDMEYVLGMDITGFDTIAFTTVAPSAIARKFGDGLFSLWPQLLVEIEPLSQPMHWRDAALDNALTRLDGSVSQDPHPVMYFYQAEQMMKRHPDHGFTLHESIGPIAIHFRNRPNVVFRLNHLEEVHADDRRPGSIDPYFAWLCSPALLEVTLVTPADPGEDAFSEAVAKLFLESLISA